MPRYSYIRHTPSLHEISEGEVVNLVSDREEEEDSFAKHFSVALRGRLSSALSADDTACKSLMEEFLVWLRPSGVNILPRGNTGVYYMQDANGVTTYFLALSGSSNGTTSINTFMGFLERSGNIIRNDAILSTIPVVTVFLLLDHLITVIRYETASGDFARPTYPFGGLRSRVQTAIHHQVRNFLQGPHIPGFYVDEEDIDEGNIHVEEMDEGDLDEEDMDEEDMDEEDIDEENRDTRIFIDLKDWENNFAVRKFFISLFHPQMLNRYV